MADAPQPPEQSGHEPDDESRPDKGPDSEPGRPKKPGELDPELLRLPRKRIRIGWLMCASIVVFSVYLVVKLQPDIAFARIAEPTRVTAWNDLFELDENSYVEVDAPLDRALLIRAHHGKFAFGRRLAPVQGSDSRLWVLMEGNPWQAPASYDELYRGRLVELASLPIHDAVADWVGENGSARRRITVDSLRQVLTGSRQVVTTEGNTHQLAKGSVVALSEVVPGKALVTVTATSDHPDEDHWRAALKQIGLLDRNATPARATHTTWSYHVAAPDGVEAISELLVRERLFAAIARPLFLSHYAPLKQLSTYGGDSGGVVVEGAEIPWSDVTEVSVLLSQPVPDGARVIVSDEHPEDYWYALPLAVIMGLFALLFLWGLTIAVRQIRTEPPPI